MEITKFDKFPEDQYKKLINETIGTYHPFLKWEDQIDEAAKQKIAKLRALQENEYKLRLGVVENGELVALSYSYQTSAVEVIMAMSTVRPDYRGRGIYTALAKRVLEETREAGFQAVTSKHMMTNNPILIAKLKLGFKIYALETHATHGTLLNMVFHHNELMAKSLRFRTGEIFLFGEDEIYENYGLPIP